MQYQTTIGGKFSALADRKDMDSEKRWDNFKNIVNETVKELVGYRKKQHKPWINKISKMLCERQRTVRVQIEEEVNTERRTSLR